MILLERLRDYCENSTIHGLRYLAEEGRHFIERIFWLIAVCTSTVGMYVLAAEAWDSFMTHPASFVTDTNYLTWNTSFPAVTICERMDGSERIIDYMENQRIDKSKLFLYISTVTNRPDDCIVCKSCNRGSDFLCPECDEKMINQVFAPQYAHYIDARMRDATGPCDWMLQTRGSCGDLFEKCFWNDEEFDCCANFLPIMTEMGPCFTINSLLARPKQSNPKIVKMISNMKNGPGALKVFIVDPVDVYLHGPEEVPYRNHPKDMVENIDNPAMTSVVLFKLMEIENDPGLRILSVERRGCRFWDEPLPDSPYPIYSYSTCIVECRMKMQIELCNCTTVFMPRWDDTPLCSPLQLHCLYENARSLRVIKQPWKDAEGLACNCSLGCSELEMTKIWSNLIENPDPDTNIELVIKMASLPSERFQRNVVRTKLDLVVSLGGTAGLFLGASLLSGVELLIYMLVRSCTRNKESSSNPLRSAKQIPIIRPLRFK